MSAELEKKIIDALEFEWGEEGGFLFDYRDGKFNEDAYRRTHNTVVSIDFSGKKLISKQIVALIYSIPFFLVCNKEFVVSKGGSDMLCEYAINAFGQLLMDKLETP